MGVEYLVAGTLQQIGGDIRIRMRLTHAPTDRELWGETYSDSVSVENLFAIQASVAGEVAARLQAELSSARLREIATPPTRSEVARELVHRSTLGDERFAVGDQRVRLRLVDSAVVLDPDYVGARALRAAEKVYLWWLGADGGGTLRAEAREELDRLLVEHPNEAAVHFANGTYHYYTDAFGDALRAWTRARELGTVANMDKRLADVLRRQGDLERALSHRLRALEQDPRSSLEHVNLGFTYQNLRRFAEADSAYRRAIELNALQLYAWINGADVILEVDGLDAARHHLREAPADVVLEPLYLLRQARFDQGAGDHVSALRALELLDDLWVVPDDVVAIGVRRSLSLLALGDTARATAELEQAARLLEARLGEIEEDGGATASELGVVYAMLGRADEAVAHAELGARLMPVERDAIAANQRAMSLATAYAWAGRYEEAVSTLEILLQRPSPMTPNRLAVDPIWDPLRGRPAFDALLSGG